jgi:uncharacterized Zn finger protein
MGEIGKRFTKGRNYVRNDAICHLEINNGVISAKVSGHELYDVEITFDPIQKEVWEDIIKKCDKRIHTTAELYSGKFSRYAAKVLLDPRVRFMPSESEVHFKCSCGVTAPFCPHVSAALYGVANRLDRAPINLFLLRGVDAEDLISPDPVQAEGHERREGSSGSESFGGSSFSSSPPQAPITAESITLDTVPSVVLRRRNGREERLELRERVQEPPKEEPLDLGSSDNPDEYVPPKKKRLPRLFTPRRKRTGWVSVDLGNDGDKAKAEAEPKASSAPPAAPPAPKPAPAATTRAPRSRPAAAVPAAAQKPTKIRGDGEYIHQALLSVGVGVVTPPKSGFEPPDIILGGANAPDDPLAIPSDAQGAPSAKRGKKRRGDPDQTGGELLSPGNITSDLTRRFETEDKAAERAEVLQKAHILMRGANAKHMKKQQTKESAAKKATKVDQKLKAAERQEKETTVKAKVTKKYPPKISGQIPKIDFERVTGKNIRDLRKSMGWSLEVFSDRLGICKATVDRWETTRGVLSLYTPSQEALKKLYRSITKKYGG